MILLDTSILIEYFRKKNKQNTFFYELSMDHFDFAISTVVDYQILIGSKGDNNYFWKEFLNEITIIPFDVSCSNEAVDIYKNLKSRNLLVDLADLYIGATARAYDLKVATNNVRHFERIEGLNLIKRRNN